MKRITTCLPWVIGGFLLITSPIPANGKVLHVGENIKTFMRDTSACAKFDICDLKSISFHVLTLHIPPGDTDDTDMFLTKLYATYTTDRVDQLEKYSFVQFIRGCAFYSVLTENGVVEDSLGILRVYMGEKIIAQHREWSIDSTDTDPVYYSNPDYVTRHYLYQWVNPPEKWRDDLQGNLYGEKTPLSPRLFVTDLPFPAAVFPYGMAKNSSFEFRTCLYKSADVPSVVTDGHDVNFATPITCSEWKHNFVYNHFLKRFERPVDIAPVCRRPLTPLEERVNSFLREKDKVED